MKKEGEQDLETFYWNNRTFLRKKAKGIRVLRDGDNVRHLRALLSEASISTGECHACCCVTKSEAFENILCIECKKEVDVCFICKPYLYIEPMKGYCCLTCLTKETRKRKCDLLEAELYNLKSKKFVSEKDVYPFPYKCEESITSSGLVAVSYSLREEYDDKEYIECDICSLTSERSNLVGNCMQCGKTLGLCCYYENQWSDRVDGSFEFPESAKFLCPLCIEEKSFFVSSSLSDSDDYCEDSS